MRMNIYSTFKTVVAQAGAILFLGLLGFWMIFWDRNRPTHARLRCCLY